MQPGKGTIIGLILALGGGIVGVVVAVIAEAATGGTPVVSLSIALVVIVILGWVFGSVIRPMLQAQALLQSGEPAGATILKLWDTGTTLNNDPQVGMLLEVRPPGRSPFQAEVKTFVSRLQTAMIQPGMAVQVRYDPNDTSRVAIESLSRSASELPTNAITVDGQTYATVDDMPSHVRQAYEQVLADLADADRDGIPDLLKGPVPVMAPQSPEALQRKQRLKELKGLLDAGLITEQDYEARKSQFLSEI
ncbi:MAG: SHOCT domain-containing protein [Chloroflexi bacterium]|nr:SHOCT domain-containing protein [Chloroflexota bacterium]MBU1746257.1 SHOCT domain-containing protein [Chloroflexota bacterium]